MVSLRDVADAAGVHISTASRALDPAKASMVSSDTRERIRAIAREMGYEHHALASSLRRGRSNTIGVVVAELSNPFFAAVIRGVENALDPRGFMALIAETQDDQDRTERVLRHFVRRRVDGIISMAARVGDQQTYREIAENHFPVVLAVRTLPDANLPLVTHDDVLCGELAAQHLLGLGHRHIAQLRGPADIEDFTIRGESFKATIEAAEKKVIEIGEAALHPTVDEGRRLMEQLLEQFDSLPTAVFAHNDLMAIGALEAIRAAGLSCPEDISIIGHNDSPHAAHTNPPLTTLRFPGYEIGTLAADTVIEAIEASPANVPHVSLPSTLVVRESSGPPGSGVGTHPS